MTRRLILGPSHNQLVPLSCRALGSGQKGMVHNLNIHNDFIPVLALAENTPHSGWQYGAVVLAMSSLSTPITGRRIALNNVATTLGTVGYNELHEDSNTQSRQMEQ